MTRFPESSASEEGKLNYLEFAADLERRAFSYVVKLEDMFGKRDTRFVRGEIKTSLSPHSHIGFPQGYPDDVSRFNGQCVVDIHVGIKAWERLDLFHAAWQVAHETVHLLDPSKDGEATVLEEGLATYFQYKPEFHGEDIRDGVTRYIDKALESLDPSDRKYLKSRSLILECMPRALIDAVRALRLNNYRLSGIPPNLLAYQLPDVERKTIDRLCTKFDAWGQN